MKIIDIEVYIVGYRKTDNDELIVRAGLLSDDVFNYETSLPDFDNKEMVFGDWE